MRIYELLKKGLALKNKDLLMTDVSVENNLSKALHCNKEFEDVEVFSRT